MDNTIDQLVNAITTKDRDLLSLYLIIRELLEKKQYEDTLLIINQLIITSKEMLKEWSNYGK